MTPLMTDRLQPILSFLTPLTSPLLALAVVAAMPLIFRRTQEGGRRALALAAVTAGGFVLYHALCLKAGVERWMVPLNSPLVTVFLTVILPALCLPRNRGYRLFLLWPAALLAMMVAAVFDGYRTVPQDARGFYWFLIRPVWLMAGMASLLVLLQPFLRLGTFRCAVRIACLIALVYGGFAFRQSYQDYQTMLGRRRDAVKDMMLLSETSPVLQSDKRMLYLPSAPCRFTADGGYVQGCNIEMFQRLLQIDFRAVARQDPTAVGALTVVLGALTLFLALCFFSGRATCGWLCPLSTLGSLLDWARRKLGLPHYKPSQPVKMTCLAGGLGLAGLTLAMAKIYPHLDAEGKFAGCKIPLYPFCKICPSQQVCPVAAHGPAAYAGLPTWDWGFGFFRAGCIGLLAFFLLSYAATRRLWCRLCPMGMISGLFNRGGQVRLLKNAAKCNRCGVCGDVCPMDIDLVRSEMCDPDVSSFDCVLCLKCVEKCPRDGCLSLEWSGARVAESRFDERSR